MKLAQCEFEETEYRGPLFNQLESSNLLWEPGQVFEKHIGVDRAFWTAHAYLHSLHGYRAPLAGAVLSRYRWDYIWDERRLRKKMPPFRLNLFIQAKRPQYGRWAPRNLRAAGLRSPYWRFETTHHQQIALEKLASRLHTRAIVCYACPVFHKQSTLYKWTVEPQMVENSTFPSVQILTGHTAWNFSVPGAMGVANSEPKEFEEPPLMERVATLIRNSDTGNASVTEELESLAAVVTEAMEEEEPGWTHARFAEGVRGIREIASHLEKSERSAVIAYFTVRWFAQLHRVDWLVAGESE